MSAPSLNLRSHGLHMAVASLAAQGIRNGLGNGTRLEAYVLEALQGLTLLEIRDMLQTVVAAQNDAKGLPLATSAEVFANSLRQRTGP